MKKFSNSSKNSQNMRTIHKLTHRERIKENCLGAWGPGRGSVSVRWPKHYNYSYYSY